MTHMNVEAVFGHFPVLESENLVLSKIEEIHVQDVFSIYDNEKVFDYCGIIPKHNIKTVHNMIGQTRPITVRGDQARYMGASGRFIN